MYHVTLTDYALLVYDILVKFGRGPVNDRTERGSESFFFSFNGGEKTKSIRYGYKTENTPEPSEFPNFYVAWDGVQ